MVNFLKGAIKLISKKEIYSVIVVICISYFAYKTIAIILEESKETSKNVYKRKKRTTINSLFQNIAKYIAIITSIIIILSVYGVNVKGMLAGIGIVATIVGLALQDTFKDIINGISIMMEKYFIVGDIVTFNDFSGEVIEFSLKSTKIRNAEGTVLIVANRNIMEVRNISKIEPIVRISICLPYEESISKLEKIIEKEIIPEISALQDVIKSSVEYLGIDEMADSCVKYLIQFKCKRETQWKLKRTANKIILETLNKNKVSVPYPQLEVHNEE